MALSPMTVKNKAHSLGAFVCGVASAAKFSSAPQGFRPTDILPSAQSVIVMGNEFNRGVFEAKTNAPYTLVRNHLVQCLDSIAVGLSFSLEAEGYLAVPVPSSEPYECWDASLRHGRGILSLKHAAQLAGLGRIGKNTLLINKRHGNRLWLSAVITDAVIEADPMTATMCPDNCRICLDACPESALDGTTIDQQKCRRRCASVTEGGGLLYACNICRRECPFSRV